MKHIFKIVLTGVVIVILFSCNSGKKPDNNYEDDSVREPVDTGAKFKSDTISGNDIVQDTFP